MRGRALQLDGMRAIAMVAICWDHWCPKGWARVFPFEIFLFFFLVLTGYLITGSLLRERERKEALGKPWRKEALKTYQIRRGLRILAPYYAALALAWIVRAPDVTGAGMLWYVTHLSNIHMAMLGYWPSGTNHFYSLSMQQQFYLIWPFVMWFTPRRLLVPAILAFAAVGPATRMLYVTIEQWIPWPNVMTWACLDYFGIGGLFALAVHRGMSLESPGLRWISGAAMVGYLWFFIGHERGWENFDLRYLQQTLLAIALCAPIAWGVVGFRGPLGRALEHRIPQRIGQLSYGIYLFHNLAPLVTGKILWVLWNGSFETGLGAFFRIGVYAAVTWGLTVASWRWIERPLQEVRSRIGPPVVPSPAGGAAGGNA